MEYINYIGEDVDLHLHNYSDAEFLPGSIKNIYNNGTLFTWGLSKFM